MITVFGDKLVKGKTERLRNLTCAKCNANDTLEITCQQSYYHIFFLPTVPNDRTFITQCANCGDIQDVDPKQDESLKAFSAKTKNPIWMWIGLPIWLTLFGFIAYQNIFKSEEQIAQDCLSKIVPTQTFEIKTADNKKQLLRVYSTSNDRTITYIIGVSTFNLDQKIEVDNQLATKEFFTDKNLKKVDISEEEFKKLPIINCH
jgi:hypothetical protein